MIIFDSFHSGSSDGGGTILFSSLLFTLIPSGAARKQRVSSCFGGARVFSKRLLKKRGAQNTGRRLEVLPAKESNRNEFYARTSENKKKLMIVLAPSRFAACQLLDCATRTTTTTILDCTAIICGRSKTAAVV